MINFMQKLLREEHWEVITNNCELKDKDKQNDMCVTIEELPSSGLKIAFPTDAHDAMVKKKHTCDHLILISDNDHIDLYFIELKKTFHPKAYKQILSTVPIWNYFVSVIKIYFDEEAEVIEKYKITPHFVVIVEKRYPTRDKQSKNQPKDEITYKNKNFKIILHFKNIPIPMKNLKCQTPS